MIEGAKTFAAASLILLALSAGQYPAPRAAHIVSKDGYTLPDRKFTPGVVALSDSKKVCGVKWGRDARHVTAGMRAETYRLYGATETFKLVDDPKHHGKKKRVPDTTSPGACCEVDHLISRELGGADMQKNLWPQKWEEARLKDRIENWLHRQVCGGAMPLATAQHLIRTDWGAVYKEQFGGKK